MAIEIKVDGVADVQYRLARAQALLREPGQMLRDIGYKLEANIRQRFITKRDPNGAGWAPIRPATLAIYKRRYRNNIPGSLMYRSGRLAGSTTSRLMGDVLEVGVSTPYAGFLETGTRKMVRRGMVFGSVSGRANALRGTVAKGDVDDMLWVVRMHLARALQA